MPRQSNRIAVTDLQGIFGRAFVSEKGSRRVITGAQANSCSINAAEKQLRRRCGSSSDPAVSARSGRRTDAAPRPHAKAHDSSPSSSTSVHLQSRARLLWFPSRQATSRRRCRSWPCCTRRSGNFQSSSSQGVSSPRNCAKRASNGGKLHHRQGATAGHISTTPHGPVGRAAHKRRFDWRSIGVQARAASASRRPSPAEHCKCIGSRLTGLCGGKRSRHDSRREKPGCVALDSE